ncbi:Maf-like protein [Shewanella sp.]|nr:Maf-like protein [Shewanella sp.]
MKLVLASASPRRKELLAQLCGLSSAKQAALAFDILATDIDESHHAGELAADFVVRLATEKAIAGLERHPSKGQIAVLGSDTIVVLAGEILGKPTSDADAKAMLTRLSGQVHQVMTAVAVTDGTRTLTKLVTTSVQFCAITEAEILTYIATGEPMDKAGSYGIQGLGGCFVSAIEGSYSAVVGLPLVETRALLCDMNIL